MVALQDIAQHAPRRADAVRNRAGAGLEPRCRRRHGARQREGAAGWCRSSPARCFSATKTRAMCAGTPMGPGPRRCSTGRRGRGARFAQSAAVRRRPRYPWRGARVDASLPADVRRIAHRRHRIYHTVRRIFTDEHRRLLGRVSEQAAAVIFNSTRFEQTQHESHTDALTGLANRRSLDRQFESGLERASRTRGTVSLIVLDLDRLKEINDTYGHEAGDRALRAVGTVLGSTIRDNDLCARFAGDEFVVLLWDTTPEQEARRVRELQMAVAATHSNRGRRAGLALDQCRSGAIPRRRPHVRRTARRRRRAHVPRQGRPALAQLGPARRDGPGKGVHGDRFRSQLSAISFQF